MVVLDACVLISFLGADAHTAKAASLLDTEDELILHPLTLAECAVGAFRTAQAAEFRRAIQRIGIGQWTPDDEHWYRVAQLAASTHLKPPDCCVLDAARTLAASLATFDDQLTRVAKSLSVPVDDGSR